MLSSSLTVNNNEIKRIFSKARSKLDDIEEKAIGQKKVVVQNLAKELEGKIHTDMICSEIVNQFRGKVSERFIRECLQTKYKQAYRKENAKKQKKASNILAALPPLNKSSEIDRDSIHQEDNLSTEEIHDGRSSFQCVSCNNLRNLLALERAEKSELAEALSNATKPVLVTEMLAQSSSFHMDKTAVIRFGVMFHELQQLMTTLFNNIGDLGKLQFELKINTRTSEPLSISIIRQMNENGTRVLRLSEDES